MDNKLCVECTKIDVHIKISENCLRIEDSWNCSISKQRDIQNIPDIQNREYWIPDLLIGSSYIYEIS